MVSLPGFGMSGPYKYYQGFGANVEAVCGLTLLRGYRDLDPTTTSSTFHMDAASGITATFAILSALHFRNRTGKGQFIDFSQAENMIPHIGETILDYTMNGRVQTTLGNRHPSMAPHGCYPCKGEDKWVTIAVASDEEWKGFCRVMGNPPWTQDERFSNILSRWRHQDELDRLISEWTKEQDSYEVMELLQKEGVAAGPVLDDADAYADPHIFARGFFEPIQHREAGTHIYPGIMWKMPKTPGTIRSAPPCLGEHNDYVYKEVLKMSDEEIARLKEEEHIGDTYLEDA